MAEWKKVLVSGSNIEVNQITATGNTDIQGTLSLPDFSDVSASLAAAVAGTATAGDGIFVTGNIVSVDSASLATDMAGDFITATNGTLNLATSVGALGTNQFTGSFSGSLDGSINVVDTNANASYQLVFREGTLGGFSNLYADEDNAKLRYNPSTNTLENTTLIGDVTGDLTGTADSASHVAPAYDTVGVSNATISLTNMGGSTDQITVNNVENSDSASLAAQVTVTADNSTDANFYITTAKNVGGQPVYAHAGLAFNPSTNVVSPNSGELHFEATTFTGSFKGDLAGTADIARTVDVSVASANANYRITMVDNTGTSGESVYVDSGLTYNPSTDSLTVSGDLIVNGTTTNINTTNLDVEDAFILLKSGSSNRSDSGIIFGGAEGAAQTGSALIWDASYNSNDGRLAVVNTLESNATNDPTPDYYVAGVFIGDEANAAAAEADHSGNIRIDGADIYIYVE